MVSLYNNREKKRREEAINNKTQQEFTSSIVSNLSTTKQKLNRMKAKEIETDKRERKNKINLC